MMDSFAKDLKWYVAIFALVSIVWLMVDQDTASTLKLKTGEHTFEFDLKGESGQITMTEIINSLLSHPNGINAAEATLKGPFKITPPDGNTPRNYTFVNIEQEGLITELNKLQKSNPDHPVIKMLRELSDTHDKDSFFKPEQDPIIVFVDSSLKTNKHVKTCDDRYEAREVTLYNKNRNKSVHSSFAVNATTHECLRYSSASKSSIILISEQTRLQMFPDTSTEIAENGIEAGIFASPKGYILRPNPVALQSNTLFANSTP